MLSDLCSSTPKTSVSLSVPVSLSPSLPLSVLCSVCTGWLFVYLRTDRLRFDQVRAPGATHRWPSSLVVCSHARTQTHARTHTYTHTLHTHIHSFMRTSQRQSETMWDRWREKEGASGGFDVLNIFCVRVSNSSHHNEPECKRRGSEEIGWRLIDPSKMANLNKGWWEKKKKQHRGGLGVSFPLDFETRPLLAPLTDRYPLPGSYSEHPATVISSFQLPCQCVCVYVHVCVWCDWEGHRHLERFLSAEIGCSDAPALTPLLRANKQMAFK